MSRLVQLIPTGPERRRDGAAAGDLPKPPVPDLVPSLAPVDGHRRAEVAGTPVLPLAPSLTRDQVMTAAEVADLLHLPVATVYHLARRGKLPASRFGRTWRFLRPRIEEMLRA